MAEEVPVAEEGAPADVPTVEEAEDFDSGSGKSSENREKRLKKLKKVLAFYGYAVYNRSRCDVDSVEA